MRNLPCALCIIAGGIALGFYGWNWWFFAVFIAGILLAQYLPENDRQLQIINYRLRNEQLELENQKLRQEIGGRRK
jgi:hypothetical protein